MTTLAIIIGLWFLAASFVAVACCVAAARADRHFRLDPTTASGGTEPHRELCARQTARESPSAPVHGRQEKTLHELA